MKTFESSYNCEKQTYVSTYLGSKSTVQDTIFQCDHVQLQHTAWSTTVKLHSVTCNINQLNWAWGTLTYWLISFPSGINLCREQLQTAVCGSLAIGLGCCSVITYLIFLSLTNMSIVFRTRNSSSIIQYTHSIYSTVFLLSSWL